MENNTNEVELRDKLRPFIDVEIMQLLRYLGRERSWVGCFRTLVVVDGIVARLDKGRLWRGMLHRHPEITEDFVSELVAVVALSKGLSVLHKGKLIQAELVINKVEPTE